MCSDLGSYLGFVSICFIFHKIQVLKKGELYRAFRQNNVMLKEQACYLFGYLTFETVDAKKLDSPQASAAGRENG